MNSVADIWKCVLDNLSVNLTPVAISTWFSDCEAVDLTDNRLVLYVPSPYKKSIIHEVFLNILKYELLVIFACDMFVMLVRVVEVV